MRMYWEKVCGEVASLQEDANGLDIVVCEAGVPVTAVGYVRVLEAVATDN
jgi:hypothetical protein